MDFGAYIKEAGPFTAPLCLGMMLVIRWLLLDRARLLATLVAADADRMALRERRATDLADAAEEYRVQSEHMRSVMSEWTARAQAVLDIAARSPRGPR